MDIEEFYDANPARRSSEEFEFGRDWSDSSDRRAEVSWVQDTGELYVMSAPIEPIIADGAGDEFVKKLPTEAVTVEVLGVVKDLDTLERILSGWTDAMAQPNSIEWARERFRDSPTILAHGSDGQPVGDAEAPTEVRGARPQD